MNPVEIIIKKRDGEEISPSDLNAFISNYIKGNIDSTQMSAFLMAVYFQGMTPSETHQLTDIYINSGSRIEFPQGMPTTDKHSTGGVGDKISLMLAPIVAACGIPVPMISGRGLGHTGGTLDKLESIPGFRTDYSKEEFMDFVNNSGLAIISQSSSLVPADRLIYPLRDTTGTVESLPLITASIMSKKIAEGTRNLVIDLKVGSGAFMKGLQQAKKLGKLLTKTGDSFGQKVKVVYTNMNSPLGFYCGNALEAKEAIDYLKGKAAPDVDIITQTLAREMLLLADTTISDEEADRLVKQVIDDGSALAKMEEMIRQQNGDPKVINDTSLLPQAKYKLPIITKQSGYIKTIDTRQIGYALVSIGAGRQTLNDQLDPAAGAYLPHKIGAKINKNDELGLLLSNDKSSGQKAAERIAAAYHLSDNFVNKEATIISST